MCNLGEYIRDYGIYSISGIESKRRRGKSSVTARSKREDLDRAVQVPLPAEVLSQ